MTAAFSEYGNRKLRAQARPSEKAYAYKMKMEAMKRQGERTDLTSRQVVGKLETEDKVDSKEISFNPAVELSFLKPEEQQDFLSAMDYAQAAPSLSQAQRMKKMSQEGTCSLDSMCEVMNEIKKSDRGSVSFSVDNLKKYFPKSYTPKQMEDTIIRLLEAWQRRRQRDQMR